MHTTRTVFAEIIITHIPHKHIDWAYLQVQTDIINCLT